jgi:hypothetical protein
VTSTETERKTWLAEISCIIAARYPKVSHNPYKAL